MALCKVWCRSGWRNNDTIEEIPLFKTAVNCVLSPRVRVHVINSTISVARRFDEAGENNPSTNWFLFQKFEYLTVFEYPTK